MLKAIREGERRREKNLRTYRVWETTFKKKAQDWKKNELHGRERMDQSFTLKSQGKKYAGGKGYLIIWELGGATNQRRNDYRKRRKRSFLN